MLPHSVVARVADADRITVRMLLNHTSGIPEYSDEKFYREVLVHPRRIWKVEELLDRAAAQPRAFAPGERYAYSNTDYNLLGLVIERATGKPWRMVVRERIIDRLGLKRTSLPEPGHVSIGSDASHGYELVNGKLRDASDVDPSMAGAAGGNALVTTTQDLSQFRAAGGSAGFLRHLFQDLLGVIGGAEERPVQAQLHSLVHDGSEPNERNPECSPDGNR